MKTFDDQCPSFFHSFSFFFLQMSCLSIFETSSWTGVPLAKVGTRGKKDKNKVRSKVSKVR